MGNAVYEKLKELKNDQYRDFQSKLVPNIPAGTILGVKTPDMRRIAKNLTATAEGKAFLNELPHEYYEENLVHFFMISGIKDFEECVEAVEHFLPYVDCWPVCDQSSPASFKKNHEKLLPYIRKWIASDHIYTARFGIRMLMNEFLGDDFDDAYPELVASVRSDEYYLNMMIAWYFATALAKQYDRCIVYLTEHRLDDWTHKKTIRKALESYRIPDDHKAFLRTLL